jgi:hypothetical protein
VKYLRGKRNETLIDPSHVASRIAIETFQIGSVTTLSNLIIRNASNEDSGNFKCEATSDFSRPVFDSEGISIHYGPGELCIDRKSYAHHCDTVVEHKFCGNKYYGQYCCLSCTQAGFLPGGL